MSRPYKCPKCGGVGWLQYNPDMPYAQVSTSCGPWQCDVCVNGIIWETEIPPRIEELEAENNALRQFKPTALKWKRKYDALVKKLQAAEIDNIDYDAYSGELFVRIRRDKFLALVEDDDE